MRLLVLCTKESPLEYESVALKAVSTFTPDLDGTEVRLKSGRSIRAVNRFAVTVKIPIPGEPNKAVRIHSIQTMIGE